MPINPNMELWLAELETTDRLQSTGSLYDRDECGFCCLGIACEVAADNGVKLAGDRDRLYGTDGGAYMPSIVADWLGLTLKQKAECVAMNDREHLSFREIASRLRREMSCSSTTGGF